MCTNAVNVADGTVGKVIVNDQADALEVNTTPHQLCTYEHPDLALAETAYSVVTLQHTHSLLIWATVSNTIR